MSTVATSYRHSNILRNQADRRIERSAETRLHASAYRALRVVECDFCDGVLTLHGRLPSFFLKQMAQVLMRGMDRVDQIVNVIEVSAPRDPVTARGTHRLGT